MDPVPRDWLSGAVISRGFVHAISCTTAGWLTHANAILAAQPIREVTLTTWPNVFTFDGSVHDPADFTDDWPGIIFHLPPEPPE